MHKRKQLTNTWDWEIKTDTSWLGVSYKELVSYKDLLFRLTRKDFLSSYQQTLLGPFWILLQPILTVITYVIVFNNLIGISTGNAPNLLFNLIGITLWNLFSEVLIKTSQTFTQNVQIFSKVYFPRIITAFSVLWLQLLLFGIQFLLLLIIYITYVYLGYVSFNFSQFLVIFPVIIVTSSIGFGVGLIFSVLTAKYRDLFSLMNLIIRLLMFICPVFYSLDMIPDKVNWLVNINPLSSQFELFRFAFLNTGTFTFSQIAYSVIFSIIMVLSGVLVFNKMGDKLMDIL